MFGSETVSGVGVREAVSAEAAEACVDVTNVTGGMSSWVEAGLPVLRDDGSPGAVA